MDALITLVYKFSGSVIENKDTLLLVGIFCVGLKQVFQTKIKQTACDKIHEYHAIQISEAKRDSKEALDLANKAHNCTLTINASVKRLENVYEKFTEWKHGGVNEKTS